MNNLKDDYIANKDIYSYGIDTIIEAIKSGKLVFPYIKYRITEQEIKEKFNNLKKYEPKLKKGIKYEIINLKTTPFFKNEEIMKYKGQFTLMVKDKSDYLNYNILSDYFNEECRMECKRYDTKISPHEYWKEYPNRIVYGAYTRYKKITMYTLRETVYRQIHECSSFRPTLMVASIKMFKATHVLDFSSGWGDRLIGALAGGVKYYCGVDPNPCLHPNYKKILNTLDHSGTTVKLIKSGFEKVTELPDKPFDLVFTSPPYFILEDYTKEKNQSIQNYKNVDDWFKLFLLESLKKAWEKLVIGGHMIIIINNIRNYPDFVGKMILERSKFYVDDNLAVSTYMGVISYAEEIRHEKYRSPQPMWIWKKESVIDKLNPPFIIKDVKLDENRTVHVIRDDLITGGTAMRGMTYIFHKINADVYLFADGHFSHVIPAVSYIAKILKKKIIIYIKKGKKDPELMNMVREALSYEFTEIKEINGEVLERDTVAKEEAKKLQKQGINAYHIPFFLSFAGYDEYLVEQVKKAWTYPKKPNRIWVTTGSGIMAKTFADAFPNSFINLTHFDIEIPKKYIYEDRMKLYKVIKKIWDKPDPEPPFPSIPEFDAKMWEFVLKDAKDGDFVLNRYRRQDTVISES